MGVMEKMRSSTGVILWILIFSFGILWVLSDTQFFSAIQAGPSSLGSVNGETISVDEYNNRVSAYINQYSEESGNSVTPEMRAYYQDQAWNDIVNSKLLQQKMDELGLSITDQEIVNMVTGKNPDPFIKQQFQKKDGTIDRVALQAAIDAPENSQVWVMIEQQLRQKRRQQKMTNFVQNSMVVSDHEVEQQYLRNNTTADISYVRFPYADIPDSAVNITDNDLQEYYQNHQDRYQQKESYRFQYVSYDITPTSQDTARIFQEVRNLRDEFAQAKNDSLFLFQQQSSTPYSAAFVDKSDIRKEFLPVLDLKNGEVSAPIEANGRVNLLKKIDETADQVKFVVFSYNIQADPVNTIDAISQDADDFSYFAKQNGFEEEAKQRGLQVKEAFATKDNPFIPGLGQSRQILDYLETHNEGDISSPLELTGQFVVVRVAELTPAGTRPFDEVESQIRNVVLNEKRKDEITQRVQNLLASNSTLESLANASGKEVSVDKGLRQSAEVIEGAGREPQVIGSIFGLNDGELSKAIPGNSAVFVIRIDAKQKADLKNLTASTRQQIRQQLIQQKGQSFTQVWLQQLQQQADIVDNRGRLLRQSS